MSRLVEECAEHMKLYEKAASFISASSDSAIVEGWKKQCSLSLKILRKVLKNKCLTVPQKQSVLCGIGRIESFKVKLDTYLKRGGGVQNAQSSNITQRVRWIDLESAFENRMRTSIVANIEHIDLHSFLDDACNLFIRHVKHILKKNNALKINTVLSCKFKKLSMDNEKEEIIIETKHFNTVNVEIFISTPLKQWFVEHVKNPLVRDLEEFEEKDSGWSLDSIINIQININKFNPMRSGGSYLPLPDFIKKRLACINVKNEDDDQCFKWAILSALHPVSYDDHPYRVTHYLPYENELNMKGIQFPVSLRQIPKFEKQNNEISVNVFGLKDKDIIPLYRTSDKKLHHINLLLMEKEWNGDNDAATDIANYHYVYIKNLSRLVKSGLTRCKNRLYICDRCLNFFTCQEKLDLHEQQCKLLNTCKVTLPKAGKDFIEFKNSNFKEKLPFIIYADCECLLRPIEEDNNDEKEEADRIQNTRAIQKHNIISIGYYIKCTYDDSLSGYNSYRGSEPALWFAKELKSISEKINDIYHDPVPMENLTSHQAIDFEQSSTCHICEKAIDNEIKVHDHCHLTSRYGGPALAGCNLNYQDSRIIPVVFHNLSGYDAHFIINDISNHFPGRVELLPLTKEKYIAFTKHVENSPIKFRFIDSFRFMAASLEKLASYLSEYKILQSVFSNVEKEKVELLTKKGIFPYEYVDSMEKLQETKLPEREQFFSSLNDSTVSEADYAHAQRVWNEFGIQTIGEYTDLYMKTDVLLLADIFENFREQCLAVYGLDPAHYYTTPGFTWDAMLKFTGVKLRLITDIDILLFIERGIRGGLSQCSHRYAKANNKYIKGFNENEEDVYLMYWDANNLYGWAMTQSLPYDCFEWVDKDYVENFNVFDIDDDAPVGYILEVDLNYPTNIHKQHNDLPFCPEHAIPPGSSKKDKKLLATLMHKKNYVIHYRTLKQALANGLELVKKHRILKFKQSKWLKPYIDLNSSMRAKAKNEFEKNLFKLMNNAVYGKTMENVRNHVDVKLMTKWEGRYGIESLISKANFQSSAIFGENLAAIELKKVKVFMNKPIYVGLTVLDVSKTLVYGFHYDYMLKMYGKKCKLLYTDTDSLIYAVKCPDLYEDIKLNIENFDTSDYPENNIFNMPRVNKKIVGLMTDECKGNIITEFIGLRSKMYSIRVNGEDFVRKIKGIKSSVVKKSITFDDYKNCLDNLKIQKRKQCTIRSRLHNVETIQQIKIALSPYDNKRCIGENGIKTRAWGHYKIR
nr:TPA_asm: PolB [Megastigmus wasp adintovirus]